MTSWLTVLDLGCGRFLPEVSNLFLRRLTLKPPVGPRRRARGASRVSACGRDFRPFARLTAGAESADQRCGNLSGWLGPT